MLNRTSQTQINIAYFVSEWNLDFIFKDVKVGETEERKEPVGIWKLGKVHYKHI